MNDPEWARAVYPHGELAELAPGFWQVTGTLPRNPIPRNMTVWRDNQNGLVVHSPICLAPDAMEQLDQLGPVRTIIAPCRLHRVDAGRFSRRYPDAKLVAPSFCQDAVSKVARVDATCEQVLPELGTIIHTPAGLKEFELHYQVKTTDGGTALVMTDAMFNLEPDRPRGLSGSMIRLIGSGGPLGITRIGRVLLLRNRAEFADYLRSLAALDGIQALTVGHGSAVVGDVVDNLNDAASRV